jgi:hypothetical protein
MMKLWKKPSDARNFFFVFPDSGITFLSRASVFYREPAKGGLEGGLYFHSRTHSRFPAFC